MDKEFDLPRKTYFNMVDFKLRRRKMTAEKAREHTLEYKLGQCG
jgi:hypothetical protein